MKHLISLGLALLLILPGIAYSYNCPQNGTTLTHRDYWIYIKPNKLKKMESVITSFFIGLSQKIRQQTSRSMKLGSRDSEGRFISTISSAQYKNLAIRYESTHFYMVISYHPGRKRAAIKVFIHVYKLLEYENPRLGPGDGIRLICKYAKIVRSLAKANNALASH